MKQETLETSPQSKTQEQSSKLQVLNIPHFYKKYINQKNPKHRPQQFSTDEKIKLIRKRNPTLNEFKIIVKQYLTIYFYELYMNKVPSYFFLGGMMRVCVCHPWVMNTFKKKGKTIISGSSGAFTLFWYLRPSEKINFMVKLVKLTGSSNVIPEIERIFKKHHNKDLLHIFTHERKKAFLNKTLFRCIRK